MSEPDEVRYNVSESADKIVLKTTLKRGTATRDEDKVSVKVKESDPKEAAEKLHATVMLVREMGTVGVVRDMRADEVNDE